MVLRFRFVLIVFSVFAIVFTATSIDNLELKYSKPHLLGNECLAKEASIEENEVASSNNLTMSTTLCNILISDDFENGFGNWIDGGEHASLINNAAYANSGTRSIRLRNRLNTSSMTSGPFNLSGVQEIQVDFSYLVRSFENVEDFWFQISDDGDENNFTTHTTWTRTVDFENDERHNPSITVSGPFSSTTYFRFRADASGNGDWVFIDDVEISASSDVDILFTSTSVDPSTTIAGGTVSGSYNVRNDGSGTAGTSTLGVFISTDTGFDQNSDILLYERTYTSIGAGFGSTRSYAIPSDLEPGQYYFLFVADYLEELCEYDEANNVGAHSIIIEAPSCTDGIQNQDETAVDCGGVCPPCLPDLVIGNFTSSETAISGNEVSISYSVRNFGEVASGPFELGFYLSEDNILNTSSDIELITLSRHSISPGGGSGATSNFDIPMVQDGNYYVFLIADPDNEVQEILETNNSDLYALTISSSCFDGILNGTEDNIDCGGNCAPCMEDCSNGIDDNNDGLIDCADLDCLGVGDCPCDHPDYDAMIALFEVTDPNFNMGGWGECNVCDWTLVVCNEFNRVSRISFDEIHSDFFIAPLPPQVGDLEFLVDFQVFDCTLLGEIPKEFGNLQNLENLILSRGELTGEIPPELGNLPNLERLILLDNNLSGCIPLELSALCDNGAVVNLSNNPCLSHNGGDFASFCAGDPCVLPDDPACPTCDDGVHNGSETGIDCGGSCQPCITNPKLAYGTIENLGESWITVSLDQSYSSMVVIATVQMDDKTQDPVVSRIRNAQGNSFEIRVQNPGSGNSTTDTYDIQYIVIEEGVYNESNHGVVMEAVKVNSSITARNGSWTIVERNYENAYNSPVVLGQVMTYNDQRWSTFWSSTAIAISAPPSSSSFACGKHIGQDTDHDRLDETVGYLVIESSSGFIGDIEYAAALGTDNVTHANIIYNYTGVNNAESVVLGPMAMDGGDGYWPVLISDTPLSNNTITLSVDEDQIRDTERNHTTEQLGYLVLGQFARCDDGIQNGDEIDIDCGGTCDPCPTCDDGIMNQNEIAIDCGGECGLHPDYSALMTLFNSTDGPNWDNNNGWGIDACDVCSWYGVTCSSNRVTRLNLESNNLTGPLPIEFGELSELQYLNLDNNNITGTLPNSITQLSQLIELDIRGNQLSGAIPTDIGDLDNLRILSLIDNQLTGVIPISIGNLQSLELLLLLDNQLSGSIPSSIVSLSQISQINLENNLIIGTIPPELTSLSSLDFLYLSNNMLTGELPADIGNLFNLQTFQAGNNQFSGSIPISIGNLSILRSLDLGSNNLTGRIPVELADITSWTNGFGNTVDLSDNDLSGCIPSELIALCPFRVDFSGNLCLSHNGGDFDLFCVGDQCELPADPACSRCDDGVQNGDEEGIDCGGSCEPCISEPKMAFGIIPDVGENWVTVHLDQNYSSMVVVATVEMIDKTIEPAVPRLRNAQGNSFELRVQNPGTGNTTQSLYDINYVVLEEGVYTEADHGIKMEAVKVNSNITARTGSWTRVDRSYANTYSSPVVLGQVMSYNDQRWSTFWSSTSTSRTQPPSSSSFACGKHVGGDTEHDRLDEEIGYIVVETSQGTFSEINFSVGLGVDNVTHANRTYSFSNVDNADVAILGAAAMDGGDGYWPVLMTEEPLSSSSIILSVDEDTISDPERSHTTEQLGYLVLGSNSSCSDGIQNGDETGVDCGGSCEPCIGNTDYTYNGFSISSSEVERGQTFRFTSEIVNIGADDDISNIIRSEYVLSIDTIFDQNDQFLAFHNSSPLDFGQSRVINRDIIIPSDVIPGDYYVIQELNTFSNGGEINFNNNTVFAPITILQNTVEIDDPDYIIIDARLSESIVNSGTSLTALGTLTNDSESGHIDERTNSRLVFFLSTDDNLSDDDIELRSVNVGGLLAGESQNLSFGLNLPTDIETGAYFVVYSVDHTDRLPSEIDTNNLYFVPLQIMGPASCSDGIQNQNEIGIDCGGICDACVEICNNNLDDDGDGLIDCNDDDCSDDAMCPSCTDGITNGDETGVDCGGSCEPCVEDCANGIDDDQDGLIDCDDSDCEQDLACTCDHPDFDALIAFYQATNGDQWASSTGWGDNCDLSSWEGVILNDNNRVSEILLVANNLTGSLPASLSQLTELTVLNLSFNQIASNIPDELSTIAGLSTLDLQSNLLEGCIPPSFSSLCDDDVNLSNNICLSHDGGEFELFCIDPTCDLNCTSCFDGVLNGDETGTDCGGSCQECPCPDSPDHAALMALYNSTSGPLWNNNTGWSEDNCDVCSWAGVVCNDAQRVTQLLLSDNNLIGALPEALGSLSALTSLIISDNTELRGEIPITLSSISTLQHLVLSDNSLEGPIPSELGSLTNLRSLILSGNMLSSSIPASLGGLPLLVELRLDNNSLSGEIPAEVGELSQITRLYLSENNLEGCIPSSFEAYCGTALVVLHCNNCLAYSEGSDFASFCAGDPCEPSTHPDCGTTEALGAIAEARSIEGELMSVYPNPTANNIHIQLDESIGDGVIYLYDLTGGVVQKQVVSSSQITIEMSSLPKGTYTLQLQSEEQLITKKIIKIN